MYRHVFELYSGDATIHSLWDTAHFDQFKITWSGLTSPLPLVVQSWTTVYMSTCRHTFVSARPVIFWESQQCSLWSTLKHSTQSVPKHCRLQRMVLLWMCSEHLKPSCLCRCTNPLWAPGSPWTGGRGGEQLLCVCRLSLLIQRQT